MDRKDEARQKIESVERTIEQGGKIAKVLGAAADYAAPGLGKVIEALHGTCPPLENYRADLQDVVDGKRDTMPEPPDLRKYYMPR